jgi:hypothetical protein
MMKPETKRLVAQLLATRATLWAAGAQIESQLVALGIDPETGDPEACEHPADQIEDHSTLGAPPGPFTCSACGLTQDEPFHPSGD